MKTLILSSVLSLSALASTHVVEMKRPLTRSELTAARAVGVSIERFSVTATDYFRRTYSVETKNLALLAALPVKNIEAVHEAVHFSLEPKKGSKFLRSDELFHYQWGLFNQGQSVKKLIGNTRALSIEGKAGVDLRWSEAIAKIEVGLKRDPLVAVVDMGIDFDHPDLKGRIFKNKFECDEKGEIIDSDEDRDKNGLKGDCMGWNFAARSMFDARRPIDDDGHGTHVSGIMAAESNNEGITGISTKLKILPIKVTGRIDESSDRRGIQPLTDRIAKGILYATNMGVDVINLSLGWTRSMDTQYLREALNFAVSKGVIIVAAAGNNNNNATIYPCAHFEVICVGAASIDGSLADFSNYGGEVDILAPGEEIVSTIPTESVPLQLNLQGYDIRSGTSQAAPFVSATAALLRANFPRMHRDDVMRRILDSADKGIPGKSLAGLVNLKGAFEIPMSPSVKPVFKNFAVGIFDAQANKFLYQLPIKNLGIEAKNVVIKAESLTPSFKIVSPEALIPQIRPGEVLGFRLEGDILDVSAHNQVQIRVTVSGEGIVEKSYDHEFRLARDIYKEPNAETIQFAFQGAALPIGTVKDGEVRNLINTVERVVTVTGMPEFYLPKMVKETKSLEIKFLRFSNARIEEAVGTLVIPEVTQLLNVVQMDVNFDGIDDYMVRAIACEKDCEDAEKAKKYIQYSYWKKDFTPLFGQKSVWKFLPIMFNVDIKSQRFFKIVSKDFGPVLVPVFIETGVIPASQQEIPAFGIPDKTVARRMYYLEPAVGEGMPVLNTKTVSTSSFITSIRTAFKLPKSDEVQALHLLTQSEEELKNGTVKAMLSVGKGYLRKNVVINIGVEKATPSLHSIAQNLWGYELMASQSLSGSGLGDSFAGLVSSDRLVMNQGLFSKGYSYFARDSVEVPLSTIASFFDEKNEFTFFQTPSYLMLAHNNSDGVKVTKLKINRFSFLPGTLFNDSFYPVLTKDDKDFIPSLYVDETDIQSNLVSFTTYEDGVLKSPMRLSAFIPPICKPMNPVRMDAESAHSLTLLCFENKQWVMKLVEVNQ